MSDVVVPLLPGDVVVVEAELSSFAGDGSSLFPQESAALGRAIAKRRREFEAGRLLARRAMQRLGFEPAPLLPGPRRAPRWPEGLVGSITHTRHRCAAAVARAEAYRGLGIDLEPAEPIKPGLFRMICTDEELEALDRLDPERRGVACRVIFSAKEAAYKAQFAVTETFLPFSAMTITFVDSGHFAARLNVDVGRHFETGHVFEGTHGRTEAWIATAVALTA